MNGVPWSLTETDHLLGLCGDMPFPMVIKSYNQWAAAHGFITRTEDAVKDRAYRVGSSLDSCGEWITPWAIHQILECPPMRPKRWLHRHADILKPIRPFGPKGKIFIRRASLVRFARQYPEQFAGCSRSNLFMLLQNHSLADRIATHHPGPRPSWRKEGKPVIKLTTGEVFRSITAAAKAMGVHHEAIRQALNHGWRSAGSHWAYVEQQQEAAA